MSLPFRRQKSSAFWPLPTACRILLPWPGIKPVQPAVEAWSSNHWTSREVPQNLNCSKYWLIILRLALSNKTLQLLSQNDLITLYRNTKLEVSSENTHRMKKYTQNNLDLIILISSTTELKLKRFRKLKYKYVVNIKEIHCTNKSQIQDNSYL